MLPEMIEAFQSPETDEQKMVFNFLPEYFYIIMTY